MRQEIERRTKAFAVEIVRLVGSLPAGNVEGVIGRQLLRCATSVGANYRSAARARSRRDFISKIGIAEEEADETQYWLEILHDLGVIEDTEFDRLHREAGEFVAMFVSSGRTAKFGSRERGPD
jgi:four helix bundle protein